MPVCLSVSLSLSLSLFTQKIKNLFYVKVDWHTKRENHVRATWVNILKNLKCINGGLKIREHKNVTHLEKQKKFTKIPKKNLLRENEREQGNSRWREERTTKRNTLLTFKWKAKKKGKESQTYPHTQQQSMDSKFKTHVPTRTLLI